jgi:hypothetical protein
MLDLQWRPPSASVASEANQPIESADSAKESHKGARAESPPGLLGEIFYRRGLSPPLPLEKRARRGASGILGAGRPTRDRAG